MDDKNNHDDEFLLPGFRFHPTDEELVEFYLKRKLQQQQQQQQQPLPFELIKQVDIYKYDPWDLPRLTSVGEKEWYFYCPRGRKYKNSTRPNRVTGSGFWKATGTDRPIYSSGGIKCLIGFKKSLVFYRGRAAKCMKTDWMMHEFRLPPASDAAKRNPDKNFPTSDSLAICKIFRKTVSMANRALSLQNDIQFNSDSFSSATENEFRQDHVSAHNLSSYKTISDRTSIPSAFTFSDHTTNMSTTDLASEFFDFGSPQEFSNGFPANSSLQVMQEIVNVEDEEEGMEKNRWRFPFILPSDGSDSWKQPDLPWNSAPFP